MRLPGQGRSRAQALIEGNRRAMRGIGEGLNLAAEPANAWRQERALVVTATARPQLRLALAAFPRLSACGRGQ